jgi:hypothetical protein
MPYEVLKQIKSINRKDFKPVVVEKAEVYPLTPQGGLYKYQ